MNTSLLRNDRLPPDLDALGRTIRRRLARQSYCHIVHPAERRALHGLLRAELDAFAARLGARVVTRAGGESYDFTPLPGAEDDDEF